MNYIFLLWDLIGEDLHKMILAMIKEEHLPKGMNKWLIAMLQ
jgi:hypothetical protein